MRKIITTFALTAGAMAALTTGAGSASAEERVVDSEVRPPAAAPCSDLPNAFVEPGGRVGADLTIKCFE